MTIRSKLIITYAVLFGLVLAAVAIVVYSRSRDSEVARLDSRLDTFATGFIAEFEDQWEDKEFPESSELEALAASGLSAIRIELMDGEGKVLFQRGKFPSLEPELRSEALNDMTLRQNLRIDSDWYRQVVRAVEFDDQARYVLRLAAPTEQIEERLANLTIILILTSSAALLISIVAVYLITGRAFRPITRMVDAAEKISGETLHHRVVVPPAHNEVSRLADALNEMMQRIEDAFKSQRQFVADASHELRTPLTVVYGELEFLRRKIKDGHLEESLKTALLEVDRLSHLVKQLLLLARIDAHKLELERQQVRLDEVLADCVQLMQVRGVKQGVTIDLQIKDVVEVDGDAELLKRAFLNVIDNAVKYSPAGGEVTISLFLKTKHAATTVHDQGPGIEPADRELVFKRFHRTPRARKDQEGSGLGLAIARDLIKAHGGQIRFEDTGDVGTTVLILLPLQQNSRTLQDKSESIEKYS